jgi:sugar phosphate isomerase/epimerase
MSAYTRRDFMQRASAAAAGALLPGASATASQQPAMKRRFCAFTKFLYPLSHDECAERIAEIGLDGIEATVRNGGTQPGQVNPERVEEGLPKLIEALTKRNLEATILTTDINEVTPLNERVVRTAAKLGVKRYRMEYFNFGGPQGIRKRLEELKPTVRELAALNREAGITGMVKNSGGGGGGSMWDLAELLEGVSPREVGVIVDVRHFGVDSLLTWPVLWEIVQPHLSACCVHDGAIVDGRLVEVPLGEGIVDKRLFRAVGQMNAELPVSVHVEYLQRGSPQEVLAAIRRDFQTLRKLLEG